MSAFEHVNFNSEFINWYALQDRENENNRGNISNKVMLDEHDRIYQNLFLLMDLEEARIIVEAKKYCDSFWRLNVESRAYGSDQMGLFGTRIRIRGTTITLEWYKNFFPKNRVNGSSKTPFSQAINKPRGQISYSMSAFKTAKKWELEAIKCTEKNYTRLRKQLLELKKMRRDISKYTKDITKNLA